MKIDLTDSGVQKMVRAVMGTEAEARTGQATYLRTLTAAVQTELGSKPRLTAARGRTKGVSEQDALAALATAHGRFYEVVLAEIPAKLDAKERNAKSGFARSAASTLRTAIKAGLNPLELALGNLTKERLRAWTAEHRAPGSTAAKSIHDRARGLARRLRALIEPLTGQERAAVITAVRAEVAPLDQIGSQAPPGIGMGTVLPFDRRTPVSEARAA